MHAVLLFYACQWSKISLVFAILSAWYFVNRLFHSRDRQWHNIYFSMHKLSRDISFLTILLACILPVSTWDLKMCKYLYTA